MLYTRGQRDAYWAEVGLRCVTVAVQICGLGFVAYGGTLAAGQNITGDVVVCHWYPFPVKSSKTNKFSNEI
jgi:hypothetical protein